MYTSTACCFGGSSISAMFLGMLSGTLNLYVSSLSTQNQPNCKKSAAAYKMADTTFTIIHL